MMPLDRRLSVAPMMDLTDRHDRAFLRLISRRALLYTEMVPSGAITRGDRARHLAFDASEHPVALQVGGSDPGDLAVCARAAAEFGYDEINLNVGCPSDRVQRGRFGACLMAEPELVGDCVAAMIAAGPLPVTVKTRIGIDEHDSFEALCGFVETLVAAGCRSFAVHARKAWLKGLSPKENRSIPPLRHEVVHALKRAYPGLEIVINGGIENLAAARAHLQQVDGVMIGRAAYQNPYMLAAADRKIFGVAGEVKSREQIIGAFLPYVRAQLAAGVALKAMTRHILGLFNGQPGARIWRRHLSERAHLPGAGLDVIEEALALRAGAESRKAA